MVARLNPGTALSGLNPQTHPPVAADHAKRVTLLRDRRDKVVVGGAEFCARAVDIPWIVLSPAQTDVPGIFGG